MMRDWKTFSSTRPAFEEIGQPMILLSDDPPDHQRVRTVISRGMSPAVLRRMQDMFESEAERIVRSLLDAPDGLIDGHTDLAKKYILQVFPDAIGLGDANREMLIKFGHAQFNMFGPKNDIYRESMEAAVEVFEWVATNCKRDAVQPGGICMAMYEAADTGAVTQEEAEILVRTLYSAGSDTTIYSLGNTLRALAENPDQYQLLRTDIDEFAVRASATTTRPASPGGGRRRRSTSTALSCPRTRSSCCCTCPAGVTRAAGRTRAPTTSAATSSASTSASGSACTPASGPAWRGSRACRCCPRSRGTSRPSSWPASPR
jgi:cytochrome P450